MSVAIASSIERQSQPCATPQSPPGLTAFPAVFSTGAIGDNGYEWLEFSENPGVYYYRV